MTIKTTVVQTILTLVGVSISAAMSSTPRVITAELGTAFAVSEDLVGYNGNLCSMGTDPWSHTDFVEAVRGLKTSTVRYPAGTLGNYWDWELGWLNPNFPEQFLIGWVRENKIHKQSHRYTLEHLKSGMDQLGFEPVYCLNMLDTKTDKDGTKLAMTVRALNHAAAIGLPVKYVELGNEYYFGLPIESYNFRTPEKYGEVCSLWIETLKKDHPEARFAITGGGPMNNPRNLNWTTRAMSSAKGFDAITIHAYTDTGLFGLKKKKEFKIVEEGLAELDEKIKAMTPEERSAYALERLATPKGFADMMHTGWTCFPRKLAECNVPNEGTGNIWVTEWNITHKAGAEMGTWANVLFVALVYDSFLADGRVELSNIHNLISNTFPVLYKGSEALKNVKHRDVNVPEGYSQAAPALASLWLQEAKAGTTQARKLTLAAAPVLKSAYGEMPSLFGWQFGTEQVPDLGTYLINLNAEPMSVKLSGAEALSGVSYSSRTTDYVVEKTPSMEVAEISNEIVVLPPYSITVLRK